jgi:hypothetical protein
MTVRHVLATIVAVASIALPVLVVASDAILGLPSGGLYVLFAPAPLAFATVGWLLCVRRPDIIIGPLCLAFGFIFAAYFPIDLLLSIGATSPLLDVVATLSSASDAPGFIVVAMILILFPDGHLPGRGWRWTVWAAVIGIVGAVIGFTLDPGPLAAFPGVMNPVGIEGFPGDVVGEIGYVCLLALLVAAVGALVARWRQGRPVERAQIKWVAAASLFLLVAEVANLATFDPSDPLGSPLAVVLASTGTVMIPVAIGIAILRYRLYEIDRIVSRTIGWALVTGILVAVFAGLVVALQAVLAPVTNENTLAVAASTLVAFALFQPLRQRVQRAVDRRFDRARYDGERTVTAFGSRLRDRVELTAIRGDVLATVDVVVRPLSAELWLRAPGPGGAR